MLKLRLYINGTSLIAPDTGAQAATDGDANGDHRPAQAGPAADSVKQVRAADPDYSGIIPPIQLRRMSKAVRMGIGAAKKCLGQAGITTPDAVIIGTGLGCLQDTETFLSRMVSQEERMLTPTAFIQSTHNTVAGQIALTLGCTGFNTTLSQRGLSFECAVLNASLQLSEHPATTVLCGGIDELTDTAFGLLRRAGYYEGLAAAGEGAGFLLLSDIAHDAECCITGLHMCSENNPVAAARKLISLVDDADPGRDTLYLNLRSDHQQGILRYWQGETLLHDRREGEWSTSVAVTIARLAAGWPTEKSCIWILRDAGCGDYSLWKIERRPNG